METIDKAQVQCSAAQQLQYVSVRLSFGYCDPLIPLQILQHCANFCHCSNDTKHLSSMTRGLSDNRDSGRNYLCMHLEPQWSEAMRTKHKTRTKRDSTVYRWVHRFRSGKQEPISERRLCRLPEQGSSQHVHSMIPQNVQRRPQFRIP